MENKWKNWETSINMVQLMPRENTECFCRVAETYFGSRKQKLTLETGKHSLIRQRLFYKQLNQTG